MLAVLENALEQYNESNAVMDLVLFEDAMKHIARISRADSEQEMNLNSTQPMLHCWRTTSITGPRFSNRSRSSFYPGEASRQH